MTINDILAQLPNLRPEELEQVRRGIAALQSMTRAVPGATSITPPSDDAQWVLGIINDVVAQMSGFHTPLIILRRSAQFATFKHKLPDLMEYLGRQSSQRIEQQALLKIGLELLLAWLKDMGMPIGAPSLMKMIHRLPDVIDSQFPGYARMGILAVILRQKLQE
jgi:hypothetical protein